MLKRILIVMICMTAIQTLRAQTADTARLYAEMRKLQEAYTANGLRYDFRYTYAGAHQPGRILDSLTGSVEMSAAGTKMEMRHMEFVTNPRYAIVLFKEDKVMYLYKPNSIPQHDPLFQIRMLMESSLVSKVDIMTEQQSRRIQIRFDSLSMVKSIDMHIASGKGLLSSVRYVLQTELMKAGRSLTAAEQQKYGPLAQVNMYFLSYGLLPAGSNESVHESAYFTIDNGEYKTTPAYNEYQIYKGSPNL
ncbi:hypothetical protein [uncultured Chitinophaga sp.]|uniref:hypothetical protein n=2 Tax=Chitinophaga TaxID=79328 RepID=UPI002638C159|nr:hypothetical protein [uncultured Chitinophaga sp.]